MNWKEEHDATPLNSVRHHDEDSLDTAELEALQALQQWIYSTELPESSDDPVIGKIYQMPLVFDVLGQESKEWVTSANEKVKEIIQHEIIPAVKMIAPKRGENASEVIKRARRSIHVTHFSKEVLADDYIQRLVDRVEHGITVTRIVYFYENYLDNYRWLEKFRDAGKLLPGYTELVHKGVPTPLDFVIVDDQSVLLSFPIHHEIQEFSDAVVINDSRLVRAFRTVFTLLELDSIKVEEIQYDKVEYDKSLEVPYYLKI